MWRDAVIALSLANLAYFKVWSDLLVYTRDHAFWIKSPPGPRDFAAAMLNVLLAGGLFFAGATLARRAASGSLRMLARCSFLLVLLIAVNAFRSVYQKPDLVPLLRHKLFAVVMGVTLVMLGLFVLLRWHRQLVRAVSLVLLFLAPSVVFTFAQAIVAAVRYDPASFADKPLAAPLANHAQPAARVLWLIFDEMDFRLTFLERDPSLRLGEIDRLRSQSLYASRAYPPGRDTDLSVPALLTGKRVTEARGLGAGELLLTFSDSKQRFPWSMQPNIFSRAREAGFNTAVVGWHIPYCRVLHANLTACWWEAGPKSTHLGDGFWAILVNQTRSLFESSQVSPFGQSLSTRQKISTNRGVLEHAKQVAANPAFGLVFIHLPVPHAPHVYDRTVRQFSLKNSPIRGYLDSLELADTTLGELRRSMETAGTWENTTVLLSADHPYRQAAALDGKHDGRVPFVLKLARQKEPAFYNAPFNTVLTPELLLAILQGELSTPDAVVAWMNRHFTPPGPAQQTRSP